MPTNQQVLFELVNKRTRNAKHFALADGTFQAVVSSADVHFQDESGNWFNINTDLNDEADFDSWDLPVNRHGKVHFENAQGKSRADKKANKLNRDNYDYQALQVPYYAKIPRNFKRGYSVGVDDTTLSFTPVGASPAKGYIDAYGTNSIHYQDAWNDADVRLDVNWNGVKETIILKTDRAPSSFSFTVDGPLADDLTAGGLSLSPAWLVDANGTQKDVTQTVRRDSSGSVFVDMVADVSGLAYPITIDPTVTIGGSANVNQVAQSTWTNESSPATVQGSSSQLLLEIDYNGVTNSIGWFDFNLSSLPVGAGVTSATGAFTKYADSGLVGSMNVDWGYGNSTWSVSTMCWNNQPTMTRIGNMNFGPGRSTPTSLSMDLALYVRQWAGFANTGGVYFKPTGPNYGQSYSEYLYGVGSASSYMPSISVNYTIPPGAPTVTSPNGGETWNAQQTITWTAATDSDTPQANLQYEIQLSEDNAATWSDLVALTSAGATSYTYDFSGRPQSSTCLIRIRAYDGASYGPWDQSNGVFTIQHNQAPLAPTNLSPVGGAGLDRASVIRLSWQKNDPDGTSDPQSKFDLQYSVDDGTTWTTVTQTTTNQYYDVPANTFPHGNVLWKVRTYDQSGVSGPYSAQATFLAGDKPVAPTITSPINNGTVGVSRPTIQWSSPDQAHYEAQVLKSADSSSLWDSGDVTSTNKAVTVGNDIANGTAVVVEVRVENADGIWSDWASVNVTISYTPPAISTVAATSQDTDGYVQISITNPDPSGSQPDVAYNDIHRSPSGQDTWTRIATNIPQNATFQDYAVPSGQAHDYKVTAVGNNGTSSDSAVHTITPSLKGAWISLATDPEGTVYRFKYDGEGRSADHTLTATMMALEGRTLPVADVADQETQSIKITVKCRNGTDDLAALRTLLSSKQTVLYRDGRGRKIYGFISALPEQDTQFGTDVDLTIQAVDYQEAV